MNEGCKTELFDYRDDLENISTQLNNLQNGAESLADFIEQMLISQDVISCFRLICYSIAGVKHSVDERINQLDEIQKERNPEIP